jgi:hypothetical protein
MAEGTRGFSARLNSPAEPVADDHYSFTASSAAVTVAAATAVVGSSLIRIVHKLEDIVSHGPASLPSRTIRHLICEIPV